MKKIFLTSFFGGISFALFFGTSNAQAETFKELPTITIAANSPGTYVKAKIIRAFNQYFKNATNLRWYEIEKNYVVKFILDDQENRALFTGNGQLVYHISYGTEAHLPADVQKLLRGTYDDELVTRVLKVQQDQRTIWVISMENYKYHIMARVEKGELEETKRMKK